MRKNTPIAPGRGEGCTFATPWCVLLMYASVLSLWRFFFYLPGRKKNLPDSTDAFVRVTID